LIDCGFRFGRPTLCFGHPTLRFGRPTL